MAIGAIFFAVLQCYEKRYPDVVSQGLGLVGTICWIGMMLSAVALLFHTVRPNSPRRWLALVLTSILNKNRETVPPEQISKQLGVDMEPVEEALSKIDVGAGNAEKCPSTIINYDDATILIFCAIDPKITSMDEFLASVARNGGGKYYPILQQLIADNQFSAADVYRAIFEAIASLDAHGIDPQWREYRKQNLLYLINAQDVPDKWFFYRSYIEVCYQEKDFEQVIAFSHKAIAEKEETDPDCASYRTSIYRFLGAAYFAQQKFNYAFPCLKAVADNTEPSIPILFMLTFLYVEIIQDYEKGMDTAQLCFMKLPESEAGEKIGYLEYRLLLWIAYCSSACGEYVKGCETLENFLNAQNNILPEEFQIGLKSRLSYLLVKCNRYDDAEFLVKEVLDAKPRDVTAVNVKGMCEMRHGRYPLAIRCFASIVEDFKSNTSRQAKYYLGEIYQNLALCEARLEHASEASRYFDLSFECGFPGVDIVEFAKAADASSETPPAS